MLVWDYIRLINKIGNYICDRIQLLFADEERKDFIKHVPPYCRKCDLLYECRNPKRNWKCYRGCIYINMRGM
jgi:hypothetical protein